MKKSYTSFFCAIPKKTAKKAENQFFAFFCIFSCQVKSLLDSGISPEDLIYYGLEYKFVTMFLTGQMSYDQMRQQLATAIHQFAKRQMTWFRGMERKGITIHWTEV